MGEEIVLDLFKGREVADVAAGILHQIHNIHGGDHAGVRLSGGEDVSQDHVIRMGEHLGKLRQKRFRSCIGMRLEDNPQLIMRVFSGRI